MSFEVRQTRRFARQYKKLHDNIATDVDDAPGAGMTAADYKPSSLCEPKRTRRRVSSSGFR